MNKNEVKFEILKSGSFTVGYIECIVKYLTVQNVTENFSTMRK